MKLIEWEEVGVFYPALGLYSTSTRQAVHEEAARKEEGAAPIVKAAVEASILLRSARKLRREEMSCVREGRV
jgi:hypothetical protein